MAKTTGAPRVRYSLTRLQELYTKGDQAPLEKVMRAWKGIKERDPNDPKSFFVLGGYHGEPFHGAGWGNNTYWGGYCNHGNVLFPTWHRVYLLKVEDALRSIPGCEDVTLLYWDQTSEESLKNGIPWALTVEKFTLDGQEIDNPLRSFVFPKGIVDHISADDPNYSKPAGYETARYPLSGLVGSAADKKATDEHNAKYKDPRKQTAILNQNVVRWLNCDVSVKHKGDTKRYFFQAIANQYETCLLAPNYTVFSNTTSAAEWNNGVTSGPDLVVPLESPHNRVHLAVGGCEVPGYDASPIQGANGDMGENDTAGLDPIFFFHHCNVDRVFWLWQKHNGFTDHLEIIPEYPGTNSVDAQGPTPGVPPNSWLTMESPLTPFKNERTGKIYTSNDCVHIERQLGVTYAPGSLEEQPRKTLLQGGNSHKVVRVSRVNRAPVRGSFSISAFAVVGDDRYHLGTEPVLSRWNVKYCANCQTHLEVKANFSLHGFAAALIDGAKVQYEVEIHTRDGQADALKANSRGVKMPAKIEVR